MGSKSKREWKKLLAEIGCIVCRNYHDAPNVPAEIHHVREGQGMAQRASDYLAIPLCPDHHRLGGYGVALHAGQKAFERQYSSEMDLLAETIRCVHENR